MPEQTLSLCQTLVGFISGGAVAMTGLTPNEDSALNGVPLDPPPSSRQGFGRMQLGASLPLSGSSTSMQVDPLYISFRVYLNSAQLPP